jgi:hypothetical protein
MQAHPVRPPDISTSADLRQQLTHASRHLEGVHRKAGRQLPVVLLMPAENP